MMTLDRRWLSICLIGWTLLVPSLASGASAVLTVHVSPPGIACDVGPPYTGSIPAAATQAGFTHCAANYDFTQTASFTDSLGTWQWSNVLGAGGWLSCSATPPFLFRYNAEAGCDAAHFSVGTDSGMQVFQESYYLTDKNAGKYYTEIESASYNGTSISGTSFPTGKYIEWIQRATVANTCVSPFCIIWNMSTYAPDIFSGNNPCFLETDNELNSNGLSPNQGMDYWNPTCGISGNGFGPAAPVAAGAMATTYNTYGVLLTIDDASKGAMCNYFRVGVVGGLQGGDWLSCASENLAAAPNNVYTARSAVWWDEGPQNVSKGGGNWTATSETTNIQRATVWVCPSPAGGTWQTTGQCYNNPVITTAPP